MADAATLTDIVLTRGARRVIDGLTLSIASAGVTAVMGPNGAGKSLALRLIAGLLAPDSGRIDLQNRQTAAKDVALVFQSPVLLRRTVMGNLCHSLGLLGLKGQKAQAKAKDLLKLGGLQTLADQPARQLSGGEKQRLALIRALAHDPKLLLLDEPTANLDPAATAEIEKLIKFVRDQGTAVVLVTHDRHQAARLAQHVCFLHQGRLIEAGLAQTFFAKPASPEALAYLNGDLLV